MVTKGGGRRGETRGMPKQGFTTRETQSHEDEAKTNQNSTPLTVRWVFIQEQFDFCHAQKGKRRQSRGGCHGIDKIYVMFSWIYVWVGVSPK